MQVLQLVHQQYRIDENRIYLAGHSMGAIGAWKIAAKFPDIWAALAPFAGSGAPETLDRIRHIPHFVVHGDDDRTVSVRGSRAMVEKAKELEIEVKYIKAIRRRAQRRGRTSLARNDRVLQRPQKDGASDVAAVGCGLWALGFGLWVLGFGLLAWSPRSGHRRGLTPRAAPHPPIWPTSNRILRRQCVACHRDGGIRRSACRTSTRCGAAPAPSPM